MTYPPPAESGPSQPGPPAAHGAPPPMPLQSTAVPAPQPKGSWPGVAALVAVLLGGTLPFLPVDLTYVRAFIALPFGLAGLILGLVGCLGYRRGKTLAGIGLGLSIPVFALGVVMTSSALFP